MEQLKYNLLFRWFVGLNMGGAGMWCQKCEGSDQAEYRTKNALGSRKLRFLP
jgi:hypothetical protein